MENALDRLLINMIHGAISIAVDKQTDGEDSLDAQNIVSVHLEMLKQRKKTSKEAVVSALKEVEAVLRQEPELQALVEEHLDSWDLSKPPYQRELSGLTSEEIDAIWAGFSETAGPAPSAVDQSPARLIDPYDPRLPESSASLDSELFPLPPMLQVEEEYKRLTKVDDEL
jgi:hypothetical protein